MYFLSVAANKPATENEQFPKKLGLSEYSSHPELIAIKIAKVWRDRINPQKAILWTFFLPMFSILYKKSRKYEMCGRPRLATARCSPRPYLSAQFRQIISLRYSILIKLSIIFVQHSAWYNGVYLIANCSTIWLSTCVRCEW